MRVRRFVAIAAAAMLLVGSAAIADEHGVAWNSLNSEQQQVLSRFAESWDAMPAAGPAWRRSNASRHKDVFHSGGSCRTIVVTRFGSAGKSSRTCHPTSAAGSVRTTIAIASYHPSNRDSCATAFSA